MTQIHDNNPARSSNATGSESREITTRNPESGRVSAMIQQYEGRPRVSDGRSQASVSQSLRENDVVIICMGLSGAGKSTFISLLTDQPIQVGDSLQSCTVEIGIHRMQYANERSIYLVDTPGFDDTMRSDSDILTDIALLLAALYEKRIKLAGILYLHRISDPKMSGSGVKSLRILQALCGERGYPSVVFLTTMWSILEKAEDGRAIGERREAELAQTFWADMLAKGSVMRSHEGTAVSARSVVSQLVERVGAGPAVLDIQVQLVDNRASLEDTAAGRVVQEELAQASRRYEAEVADLKQEMSVATKEGDKRAAAELEREIQAAQSLVAARTRDRQALAASYRDLSQGGELREKGFPGPSTPWTVPSLQQGEHEDDELPLPVDEIRKLEDELLRVQVELESTKQSQRHDLERVQLDQERRHVEEMGAVQEQARNSQMALLRRQADLEQRLAWDAHRRRARESRGGGMGLNRFLGMLWSPFSSVEDDEDRYYEERRSRRQRHRGRGERHMGEYY